MSHFNLRALTLIGVLASIVPCAHAQTLVNPVESDVNGDTAMGSAALEALSGGTGENTAAGANALSGNTTGAGNTAVGSSTMSGGYFGYGPITGNYNTAVGILALTNKLTGSDNTAMGHDALEYMTVGDTTAIGAFALAVNTTGAYNTAIGNNALQNNTTGSSNTALGYWALQANDGHNNTANGYQALLTNSTGSGNIAVGYRAGSEVTTGSNNIEIGNKGAATDSKSIRIGTEGTQDAAFIAGIYNVPLSGNTVVVNSNGRLGVAAVSSERFKTAIAPMGANTAGLQQLRPVTFELKTDAKGTRQYGLIAEEVAKVYPELVIRDEKGRIDGVRYDELAPMLLNEVQKQAAEINELKQQQKAFFVMQKQLADVQAALAKLQSNDQLVAQR